MTNEQLCALAKQGDTDAQNQLKNAIDDFLYDEVMAKQKINLTTAQMDEIIERLITLARNRSMRS